MYTIATSAANIMFSNTGLSNEQAAFYSSLTGFAYSFKSLWALLLEMFRTKKFFVVVMQFVLAGAFLGMAFPLKIPDIQQRTALFARVALICSFVGLLIRSMVDSLKGHLERIQGSVYLFFGLANLSLLGLWLFTRGKPRPLRIIRTLEIIQLSIGLLVTSQPRARTKGKARIVRTLRLLGFIGE